MKKHDMLSSAPKEGKRKMFQGRQKKKSSKDGKRMVWTLNEIQSKNQRLGARRPPWPIANWF